MSSSWCSLFTNFFSPSTLQSSKQALFWYRAMFTFSLFILFSPNSGQSFNDQLNTPLCAYLSHASSWSSLLPFTHSFLSLVFFTHIFYCLLLFSPHLNPSLLCYTHAFLPHSSPYIYYFYHTCNFLSSAFPSALFFTAFLHLFHPSLHP